MQNLPVQELIEKAAVLVEALPYLSRFRGKTVVIKYGGRALDDLTLRPSFCADVILLQYVGIRPVIVHGGGPQIEEALQKMNIPSRKVKGLRITDEATMEVVEMVLGAKVNKELVRLIGRAGGRAVGITGKDGGLVRARRVEKIDIGDGESVDPGLVGEVTGVDTLVIDRLASDGMIPVIAPIAMDEAMGHSLNVNADPFAAAIAAALNAEKLVLLTDVPGVRDSTGQLLSTLTTAAAEQMIERGVIDGGMIPKVRFGLSALASGVRKVHIIDGRLPHAILLEMFTDRGIGTELVADVAATDGNSTRTAQIKPSEKP